MTASILFSFNTTMIVSTVRESDGEVKRYVNRLVEGYIKFGIEKTYYL